MPAIRHRNKQLLKQYENDGFGKSIQNFKNVYSGKRCFVIGNGPSLLLEDLEKLNDEITFASNKIYRIFPKTCWRPDFYVAFEPEFVCMNIDEIINTDIKNARFVNIRGRKLCSNKVEADNRVLWINCYRKFMLKKESTKGILFSEDISKIIYDAYTVTFTILQIAAYMGFNEIYLIGMDHNKEDVSTSHFYTEKKPDFRTKTFWEGIEAGYQVARDYAKKRGIKIFNATHGGKLEIFERVEFERLFEIH